MTNRNDLSISWASDVAAFVVDPDTDPTHPSGQGGAGKFVKGWVEETEPQQWENFIIQLREKRVLAVAANGLVPWDEEVTYKVKAVTYHDGNLYTSLLPGINKNPATQPTYWSLVKFTTAAGHAAVIADMVNKYTVHTPAGQNSHNDDIVDIGGSYKGTIDTQVLAVANALSAHVALTNNPHTDTAIGVGTIPTTGGSFTGRVNYEDNLSIGTNCELMTNTTTFVKFKSLTGAIGLGVADYHLGGRWQQIFTVNNFPPVNALFHPSFVLPLPDLHFPLMNNLNSLRSTGSLVFTRAATLAYTDRSNLSKTAAIDTPAFEFTGMKLAAGTSMIVTAPGLFGARDGCLSYTLDNVVVVKDVQFTSADLVAYFGLSGNVKNFRVWSQRLTPRQRLHIPR